MKYFVRECYYCDRVFDNDIVFSIHLDCHEEKMKKENEK